MRRGHAQQPDLLSAHFRSGQVQGRSPDRIRQVGRLGQVFLTRDRAELRVAHLHRDRPRPNPGRSQPGGHAFRQRQQRAFDFGRVRDVDRERRLVADRLGRLAAAGDRIRIDAQRPVVERGAVIAQGSGQRRHGQRRQLTDGSDAETVQSFGRLGPDPPKPPDLERGQEGGLVAGLHHDQTIGLAQVAAHLGDQLVGRDPDRNGQPGGRYDLGLQPACDLRRRPEKSLRTGDIEERLIDRNLFDGRRETAEDRHHFAADALVLGAVHRHEDALRAQGQRRPQRHRRMHAELAGLVAARAYDAS